MRNYLVFDAGGTFIKYALMDENAQILEKDKVSTPYFEDHGKEDFYRVLGKVVEKYREQIRGIAMSMPGMLNSRTGYCRTAGYLAYLAGTNVAQELSQRFGLPAVIENDGKCAALAEFWRGSLKGCKNGAVMVLGTGVAGGIILNGSLYRGTHFTAGEYSYMVHDPKRKFEMDGYWGMAGGAQGLAKAVARQTGEDWNTLDGYTIFARANQGDEKAIAGIRAFADELSAQIYNLNVLLDLEVIAIGGGISRQPLLLKSIEESVEKLVRENPLKQITPYVPEPKLVNCTFYNEANLIGALYHYMKMTDGDRLTRG